jgi:asparagine synthetase B (glutamine-hydrolysing)
VSPQYCGNVAILDATAEVLRVVVEATGSYPLYYALIDDGLVFGSTVRQVSRAAGLLQPDLLGLVELLRWGYTLAGRSLYSGVARAQPGQELRFRAKQRTFEIIETSKLWLEHQHLADVPRCDISSRLSSLLKDAVTRNVKDSDTVGLMLSGGWDSRTLLSIVRRCPSKDRIAYSHGDLASREIRIVKNLCDASGVVLHAEPIRREMFRPDVLQAGFEVAENVTFPFWIHAGQVMRSRGVTCAMAGTYGEILGGHYGPSMLLPGFQKVAAFLASQSRLSREEERLAGRAIEALYLQKMEQPWFMSNEAWAGVSSPVASINGDVEACLHRIRSRGVQSPIAIVECFMAEYRASQLINAQVLSLRAGIDVCAPYADASLLEVATRLPLRCRNHNRLNRTMLLDCAPDLARMPLAATLVRASAPILVQEASRAVRKVLEDGQWWLAGRLGGIVKPPRLGWVNFECLRKREVLHPIVDDLRSEAWNRGRMHARIESEISSRRGGSLHLLVYPLLLALTVDLVYR